MGKDANGAILDVSDLSVRFVHREGTVRAVNGVDLRLSEGEAVGIVGESGCGKTITAYSILNILPRTAEISSGSIRYRLRGGEVADLAALPPDGRRMRSIRGAEIAMIFQEPMTAFSPVHTICNQICESMLLHQHMDVRRAREVAVELLARVGIPDPASRVDRYPFELSGGMRQRAMIAMALASDPRVLIADEPTTALDVTIQAQVLGLIKRMRREFSLSLILITHDLGVVAHMVDRVYVMYLGRIVEEGPVGEILVSPSHPYTKALLRSIPRLRGQAGRVEPIEGSVPDSYTLPSGCAFHPRCGEVVGDVCRREIPPAEAVGPDHKVSCFRFSERGGSDDV